MYSKASVTWPLASRKYIIIASVSLTFQMFPYDINITFLDERVDKKN